MSGIGHNSGLAMEPGFAWRKHVWTKARKSLMPVLPVEVVRLRVKRATELGLPYKTYAGIRASTGHDLIGFMFSSNALQILRDRQQMPAPVAEKLAGLSNTRRTAIVHRPVSPSQVAAMPAIDAAFAAPGFSDSWSHMRDRIKNIIAADRNAADRLLMIGDTAFEREWAEAGRMAGYLPAEAFFFQASPVAT